MAASKSWRVSPTLADIQAVMKEIGADKVVLSINFRQPYVIDEASGIRQAGAIVAGFGVSNTALLDVLGGKGKPQGKLPFALANNLQAVIDNQPDAPGYPAKDTLYPVRLRTELLTRPPCRSKPPDNEHEPDRRRACNCRSGSRSCKSITPDPSRLPWRRKVWLRTSSGTSRRRRGQLEQAIDAVEDALTSTRLTHAERGKLMTGGALVRAIPGLQHEADSLTREAVEVLFQRLASASIGPRLLVAESPVSAEVAATVLLLRELMHHLGFDAVTVACDR